MLWTPLICLSRASYTRLIIHFTVCRYSFLVCPTRSCWYNQRGRCTGFCWLWFIVIICTSDVLWRVSSLDGFVTLLQISIEWQNAIKREIYKVAIPLIRNKFLMCLNIFSKIVSSKNKYTHWTIILCTHWILWISIRYLLRSTGLPTDVLWKSICYMRWHPIDIHAVHDKDPLSI